MAIPAHDPSPPETRRTRTLGQIIDALPGRAVGRSPVLQIDSLPSDVLTDLDLPDLTPDQAAPITAN